MPFKVKRVVKSIKKPVHTVAHTVSDAAQHVGHGVKDVVNNAAHTPVLAVGAGAGAIGASGVSVSSLGKINLSHLFSKSLEVVGLRHFHQEEEEFIQSQGQSVERQASDQPTSLRKVFCLIQAPKTLRGRTHELDEAVRTKQYEGFCQLHPLLKPPIADDVRCEINSVNSSESMMRSTKEFFEQHASNAIIAVLIFNGHGNRRGMLFEEGGPMDQEVFLNECVDLLRECQERHRGFPRRLQIVFAQCYGHLYEQREQEEDLFIVSMTNDRKPFTLQQVRLNPDQTLHSAHHVDLEGYAQAYNDE